MKLSIVYEQSARDDLREIFEWIPDAGIASAYLDRIYTHCELLVEFPARGTPRGELFAGLRTIAFERSAMIAYVVDHQNVRILRVLRKGRDFRAILASPN